MSAYFLLISVLVWFCLQLFLCFKIKNRFLKLAPLAMCLLGFLYGGATRIGLFGRYSFGAISGNRLAGLVITVYVAFLSAGVLAAWIAYFFAMYFKKKR